MIELKEVKLGDFCYILVSFQSAPLFGEVVKILNDENALEVITTTHGHRTAIFQNSYWHQKEAKKSKFVREGNNYKHWLKEMLENEKTGIDDRDDQVHHREQEIIKDSGPDKTSESLPKCTESKSKSVRKSSKRQRQVKKD